MGSKLLLCLALVAAGVLVFVVVSSMSDDQIDSGKGRAVRPDEEENAIVAPPPLEDNGQADAISGDAANLLVLVTDEENHPIPGARVSTNIDQLPNAAREVVTDGAGRAVIQDLPTGKKISVRATGEPTSVPATEVVAVEAGATTEMHLILKEGGAVTGTVFGAGGAPIGVPYRVEIATSLSRPGAASDPRKRLMSLVGRPVAGKDFEAEERVFTMGGLKPGTYIARASADGYIGNQSEPFEVVKGAIRDGVTIALERGGRVSGVVVRGRTGEPVAGADVSLDLGNLVSLGNAGMRIRRPGSRKIKTDERGRFEILGVAPGEYTILASAKNLATGRAEKVKVERGRDAEGVMIALGEGGAIRGTVYGPDGRPVPKAKVQISRVNTGVRVYGNFGGGVQADENGLFHEDHLEPGRYQVKLATGGVTASASVTIVMAGAPQKEPEEKPLGPDEVMVYEGQVTTHDILSPKLCGIAGTVTDEAGVPKPGRVRLEPLEVEEDPPTAGDVRIEIPRFANANKKGEFRFTGLRPGRYALHATGAREEVSLIPGATAEVSIVVRPARVEGVVYDPDGRPAKGAHVRLSPLDRTRGGSMFTGRGLVKTNDQGAFELKDVTAGRYRATAYRGEQRGESAEFEVGPGGIRKGLRIDLQTPTEIVVEVIDRDGKPVAAAMVMLRGAVSSSPGGRTNADGVAVLKALPGTYTLAVIRQDGQRLEQSLVVGRSAQRMTLRMK